ncbi:MAG: hypothetical protein NVS3B21_06120 [Acidimicrobiales bacterium]
MELNGEDLAGFFSATFPLLDERQRRFDSSQALPGDSDESAQVPESPPLQANILKLLGVEAIAQRWATGRPPTAAHVRNAGLVVG